MTEKEWREITRNVMQLRREKKVKKAISTLRSVIRRLRNDRENMDEWKQGEAYALLALLYEDQNENNKAARCYLEGGNFHRGWINGHSQAASQRFARAALLYFKLGQKRKAVRIAKDALTLGQLHVDPSPVYEELVKALRDYQWERYEKRKKK